MSERWSERLIKNFDMFQNNSIIGLFRQVVSWQPDKAALVTESSELTYRELEQKSNQVANALLKQGVKAGEIIAVETGRQRVLLHFWLSGKLDVRIFTLIPNVPNIARKSVCANAA